jgi:NAD/NADP transhydrogenase beta subunit
MEVLMHITYLVASVLFILGLKRLSSPKTARSGNLLGAAGCCWPSWPRCSSAGS